MTSSDTESTFRKDVIVIVVGVLAALGGAVMVMINSTSASDSILMGYGGLAITVIGVGVALLPFTEDAYIDWWSVIGVACGVLMFVVGLFLITGVAALQNPNLLLGLSTALIPVSGVFVFMLSILRFIETKHNKSKAQMRLIE